MPRPCNLTTLPRWLIVRPRHASRHSSHYSLLKSRLVLWSWSAFFCPPTAAVISGVLALPLTDGDGVIVVVIAA